MFPWFQVAQKRQGESQFETSGSCLTLVPHEYTRYTDECAFFFVDFQDRLLCSPGYPQTHGNPLASASQVLSTTPIYFSSY